MNDANTPQKPKIIAVGGPTAIGKTRVGIELAKALDGEVISADSVQLFEGVAIGAATPSMEERQGVPHHLLSVLDPSDNISAAGFARLAEAAIADVRARHKTPIIVGGSGLYLRALLYGLIDAPPRDDALRQTLEDFANTSGDAALWQRLHDVDAESAAALHPNDRVRVIRALEVYTLTGKSIRESQNKHRFQTPKYHIAGVGLTAPRPYIHARINLRTQKMFQAGLIDEVEALLRAGVPPDAQPLSSIGYKDVVHYLQHAAHPRDPDALEQLHKDVATHTRRFARRQLVWFRKEPSFQWVNAQFLEKELPKIIAACRAFWQGDAWKLRFESERDASAEPTP